jgi:hypothetical protein
MTRLAAAARRADTPLCFVSQGQFNSYCDLDGIYRRRGPIKVGSLAGGPIAERIVASGIERGEIGENSGGRDLLGCVPALASGERRSLQGGKPLYRRPWLFLFARARNLESDARLSSASADLFLTRSRRTCTRVQLPLEACATC